MTPFCVYALFIDHGNSTLGRWLAWLGYFLIGVTDFVDGKIARARGSTTEFGAFIDPVADKIAIGSALISLSLLHRIWWWVTVLILFRELAVTVLRVLVLKDGVIPASRGGKIKTLVQGFSISFYVMPWPKFLNLPRDLFLSLAVLLTITTGIDYFWKALKSTRDQKTKGIQINEPR